MPPSDKPKAQKKEGTPEIDLVTEALCFIMGYLKLTRNALYRACPPRLLVWHNKHHKIEELRKSMGKGDGTYPDSYVYEDEND